VVVALAIALAGCEGLHIYDAEKEKTAHTFAE
jgi:hypothetical protein